MSEEKILTKHPKGKRGVNINKTKYDFIKRSILECLKSIELTHTELTKCVSDSLKGKFQGVIHWYVEVVKLDLEARKIIERMPKTEPQLYRVRESSE